MCMDMYEEGKVLRGKILKFHLLKNPTPQNTFSLIQTSGSQYHFAALTYGEIQYAVIGKSNSVIWSISQCMCISAERRIRGHSSEKSPGVILTYFSEES